MLGTLEHNSAQYIAGYLAKKFTTAQIWEGEREKPFQRSSHNPPIGYGMLHEVASKLMELGLDETLPDVPTALRHGTKLYPLGQKMRRVLRTLIGRDPNEPEEIRYARLEEMQNLQQHAWRMGKRTADLYLDLSLGRRINIEARFTRHIKRGTL